MDQAESHHCPGCGTELSFKPRYPWYFCGSCRALAEDGAGRRLKFANASMSGGLSWRFEGEDEYHHNVKQPLRCFIRGRPVFVREARFGGVVVQPIALTNQEAVTDLTGQT